MYLLDTNVVSELRRARPHGAVLSWLAGVQESSLFVSVVTIGEIQAGIEITRRRDDARAIELDAWVESVLGNYQFVPMNTATFREWARITYRKPPHLMLDAMIAATAIVNGLTVATRNIRDFEQFDVPIFNPFEHG